MGHIRKYQWNLKKDEPMNLRQHRGHSSHFREVIVGEVRAAYSGDRREIERIIDHTLEKLSRDMHGASIGADSHMMQRHMGRDVLPIIIVVETERVQMQSQTSMSEQEARRYLKEMDETSLSKKGAEKIIKTKKKSKINLKLLLP